ncbi:UDP-3-O-(3-hydroxymyristoyl)glucosamine N-acyltransferase [bacterium]|nr:UDP-3-O-(3-hydroxymyristoyl)glucosamine N-acyltransferase [bacterium]
MIKLKEIAQSINAEIIGDGNLPINGISSIESPKEMTVLFAERMSMLKDVESLTKIGVIVAEKPDGIKGNFLVHPNPRAAFAMVTRRFNPPYWLGYCGISGHAELEGNVQISPSAVICDNVFIGTGTSVGDNTRILPNAHVGRDVSIGQDCVIFPGAMLLDGVTIGDRVIINSNAVIGSEGFGFVKLDDTLVKMPQTGSIVIGDDVEIGASTCIDRGTIGNTVIGAGTKIDNLVQIAHNVEIGRNVRIAAQVGIPGRVHVEDDVIIGGQAGLQNGITIGKGARIAGQSGVFKSVPEGESVSGYPALPHKQALALISHFKKLPRMFERIKELEQRK